MAMRLSRSILPLAAYSARVVIYYLQHSIKLSALDIENAFISSYSNGDILMVNVCFFRNQGSIMLVCFPRFCSAVYLIHTSTT